MDNQQERLVSNDFIAGLMAGEGTFTLGVFRKGKKTRITPLFSMQMNDGETMRIVHASLLQQGLPSNMYHRPNRGCWTLQAAGFKRVLRYLETFQPLLTGTKQEAADIVGAFIASRAQVSKYEAYSEYELGLVEKIRTVNGVPGRKRTTLEGVREEQAARRWKTKPGSSEANTLGVAS